MDKPKRLYFDIETSFYIGWFWRPGYKINLPSSNIFHNAKVICIGYKWEGERAIHSLWWDKNQDDRRMLRDFIKVANEADELIFHNGDKFDLPWVRTRCLLHGLEMPPSYKTTDTLKIARSKFRFPDNKLNTIAKYLGIGTKKRTTEELWLDIVMNKSERAAKKMDTYCKHDVRLLEKVYHKLAPHTEPKVHHGALMDGHDRGSCPHCGGVKGIYRRRLTSTPTGLLKAQYSCEGCGRWHTKTYKGE